MNKEKLTHSRMQSFKLCRKKHYYEYEVGVRKEVTAKALRMGSAGHEGLDRFKKDGRADYALGAVAHEYKNCPESISLWDWEIECQTVQTLVAGYCWYWENQPLEIISSEESFEFPLRNPATAYASKSFNRAGKIDGIVKIAGRKLVLEHKFLGEDIAPGSSFWERLRLDQQCTNYIHAARELGHDVRGVVYDLIRKPTIKPTLVPELDEEGKKVVLDADGNRVRRGSASTKKCKFCEGVDLNGGCSCKLSPWRQTGDTEKGYVVQARQMTPQEWSNRLIADIGERPEWYFQRQEIARLDSEIEEFRKETWQVQLDIRNCQRGDGSWYKTVNKGSCTYCSFFSLCVNKEEIDRQTQPIDYPEGFMKLQNVHPELG